MIKVTRRDFLKGSVAIGVAGALSGTVLNTLRPSTAHADESGTIEYTPTTCAGCTTWCAVEVKTQTEAGIKRAIDVRGNRNSKRGDATNGDFNIVCPRARIALQEAYDADRVKVPMMRTNSTKGKGVDPGFVPITLDDAINAVADKMATLRKTSLADTTPQDSEAYKVVYLRGRYSYGRATWYDGIKYIYGTPNNISHSAICAEGENFSRMNFSGRWGYDDYDLDNCRYLLLWGVDPVSSNRLVSGTIKKLGERMNAGMTVVSIDPRLNATGAKAHKWLPVRPGTDGALALAIAHHILVSGLWNKTFVGLDDTTFTAGNAAVVGTDPEKGTLGLVKWWNTELKDRTPEWAASITGIPASIIREVAEGFAGGTNDDERARAISWIGPGITMSKNGAYAGWAAIALNGLVGSYDHTGGVIAAEPSVKYYDSHMPKGYKPEDDTGSLYHDDISTVFLDGTHKKKRVDNVGSTSIPAINKKDGTLKKGQTKQSAKVGLGIYDGPVAGGQGPGYKTEMVIANMANFVFSATQGYSGKKIWEEALSSSNPNGAPYLVHLTTHASELSMYADIVIPAKHLGLEVKSSAHQRSGMFKIHSLYNQVITPVWGDAINPESEAIWLIARAMRDHSTEPFTKWIRYLAEKYGATSYSDLPSLTEDSPSSLFEDYQQRYHATSGKYGSGSDARAQEWAAINDTLYQSRFGDKIYAGNGIAQNGYSNDYFDVNGRGKAWRFAVTPPTVADASHTVAASSTTTKIYLTTAPGDVKKKYIYCIDGPAAGQSRYIKKVGADASGDYVEVSKGFLAAPASGNSVKITGDLFGTTSAKLEFCNEDDALLKHALDGFTGTSYATIMTDAGYDDTATGIKPVSEGGGGHGDKYALMPHWESPKIAGNGDYKYILIDYKSRLNREGRSQNCPWYYEFKSCDAGDEKWQDVVKINPIDAAAIGVKDGDTVKITSPSNDTTGITCKVKVWAGVGAGTVAKSFGQGHWAYGRYASKVFGSESNGGNNNEILELEWERLSGSTARNGNTKVKIVKVT